MELCVLNFRYVATGMGVDRSALTLSLVDSLEDLSDYIYKPRENLLEERRQHLNARRQEEEQNTQSDQM